MKNIPYISLLIFFLGSVLVFMSAIGYFVGGMNILLPVLFVSGIMQLAIIGLVFREKRNLEKVQGICRQYHMPYGTDESVLQIVESLAAEFSKYNNFIMNILPSAGSEVIETKEVVQRIFSTVTAHFPATAVQLQLFEDISGVAARDYSIGCPKWIQDSENKESYEKFVLVGFLTFSGRKFGKLEIENSVPKSTLQSTEKMLTLITSYASLLFINAEFQHELTRIQKSSEDSTQVKTGFLATLSHEIRGPLGVIMNSVELVLDGLCGDITDEAKDALSMVKDSSHHLMDLVNDVLDYARIESGLIDASPVPISLNDLLSDMAAVVRSQAIQKNQKLTVEPPDSRLAMLCDKRHSRQILINILTNAVKYTPEGGKITLSAHQLTSERVKIVIADTGVGIPEEEFSKVFGVFQRVNNEYSKLQQGTGLGMPLTKKLVEVNGGSVGFSSEEGAGSTFWVELPLCFIDVVETEERDGEVIKLGQGELVLLVEPDEEQRSVYAKSLDQRGFSVTSVMTASEVLKELRQNKFSAVVIETDLPDLGGEDLIKSIRSTPSGSKVPLVIMSGKAFVFDLEHFIRLGVDRCLSKPFSLSELSGTIKKLIDETASIEKAMKEESSEGSQILN